MGLRSGFRFRVSGSGSWVSGIGSGVLGLGFRASGLEFWVSDFGSRVPGLGSRVSGFGFWVSGSWFRVSGLGFRVSGFISGFEVRISNCEFRVCRKEGALSGSRARPDLVDFPQVNRLGSWYKSVNFGGKSARRKKTGALK